MQADAVTLLCPLEYEAGFLRRSGFTDVVVTGPGAARITAALEKVNPDKPAVLAGLAGALVEDPPPVVLPEVIVDMNGNRYPTTFRFPCACVPDGPCLGYDELVITPAQRKELHEKTGAAYVDMESHAFAAACSKKGIPFAVIRAISDDPQHPRQKLLGKSGNWTGENGELRTGKLLADLLKKPLLLPDMLSVRKTTKRNMSVAIALLNDLLRYGRTTQ